MDVQQEKNVMEVVYDGADGIVGRLKHIMMLRHLSQRALARLLKLDP